MALRMIRSTTFVMLAVLSAFAQNTRLRDRAESPSLKVEVTGSLPTGIDDISIRKAAVASFPEYLEFLSLPNDSIKPADIQANAVWLEKAFQKRGFHTQQLANKGRPLVFAEYGTPDPKLKTVLFYMHFDGQPVVASQWSQADAWRPVVKSRGTDGKWTEVDKAELMRPDFNPELRVFARSASDDKGPIVMFLAAFDLLRQKQLQPAISVKVLLDSEEEVNSPGISAVVHANQALLQADALVIHDAAAHPSGRPTAVFGNRGLAPLTLTVYGPRTPLHSGHYGNYAPNPAQLLANLLASMKGDDGRVKIDGYYARNTLSAADLRVLVEAGDDEVALRKRIGISEPDHVGNTYQEALQYPSLNVRGMAAASIGDKVAGIIPNQAVAEIDIRTTVEADSAYLVSLVRQHIEKQGYHLVDHEPTDNERAHYSRLAQLKPGLAAEAARQPIESDIGSWVYRGLSNAYDAPGSRLKPLRLRMMGATLPTHEIVTPMHLPFVMVPVVNADNNQHAFDENLRMGNYLTGMRSMLGLLSTGF
ncbi:MAG TPA: M20/M25/M40 family metallo-hydrolase [Verrucomicrobiae bacterium]|nr:M20/M25/M40 family metallo-hydrolase [Verrucomicrobiae bacterium]